MVFSSDPMIITETDEILKASLVAFALHSILQYNAYFKTRVLQPWMSLGNAVSTFGSEGLGGTLINTEMARDFLNPDKMSQVGAPFRLAEGLLFGLILGGLLYLLRSKDYKTKAKERRLWGTIVDTKTSTVYN